MTLSLHTATVSAFLQQLGALRGMVAKGQAWCETGGKPEAALLGARLADDMWPLRDQVRAVVHHSFHAIAAVRSGNAGPPTGAPPESFAGLLAMIDEALAALAEVTPAELEALAGDDVVFKVGDLRMAFTAQDFLLTFSLPNLYFHAATTYDILRHMGLELGKRDFLGRPRLKA